MKEGGAEWMALIWHITHTVLIGYHVFPAPLSPFVRDMLTWITHFSLSHSHPYWNDCGDVMGVQVMRCHGRSDTHNHSCSHALGMAVVSLDSSQRISDSPQ